MKNHFLSIFFLLHCIATYSQTTGEKPNFIFIVADDLNDYIGPLGGHPQIQTPAISALAENGYVFSNSYCNSPVCAPSRTSMLSGKDPAYTQVYSNDQYLSTFRDNFTIEKNNEEVITLPEHLKNNGYFTQSINKIFHYEWAKDYDKITPDPCAKDLSWSKVFGFTNSDSLDDVLDSINEGITQFNWGLVDSSMQDQLKDYRTIDSAITFLHNVEEGSISLCDGSFFLALGLTLPHLDLYAPEKYYSEFYLHDIYSEPFIKPYNEPFNAFPYNGIVIPPQPSERWADYYALGPLGKEVAAGQGDMEMSLNFYLSGLTSLPEIDPLLTDEERNFIIVESKRANAVMAYMAGVQFIDAQIGRLLDVVNSIPGLAENTIIVFIGDNGFSLGEKHHWMKRSFWETDIRVPLIIFDPRRTGNVVCDQSVALLDLYPTICDLAGIPYPVFSDSTSYLDGKSLLPILNNASLKWSRPVLISWEAEPANECSCFPQYAVRSDKFSYIKYQSDGGDPEHDCVLSESFQEEELYEVGVKRQTDPNEWNNLIADPDYASVINYLQQFLPDSSLYLQKAHTAIIINKSVSCLYKYSATLKLKANLYDPEGIPVTPASFAGYTFEWTNNLTSALYTGPNLNFLMSSIPPSVFTTNERIMIYLHVYDETNKLIAFATEYYYINQANKPVVNFDVSLSGTTATVIDYSVTGTYTNSTWNFGDGIITKDFIPAPHTYSTGGAYIIKNSIQYGNSCTLVKQKGIMVLREDDSPDKILLYPVPASDELTIENYASNSFTELTIYNTTGNIIKNYTLTEPENIHIINVSDIKPGIYVMKIRSEAEVFTKVFEVLR
ncbi:MAG: sulfatase-like hydrolase/transferase [Fimbriimonadaceae bacterium]|nr:sulfatase-like hydrolase/transferase [Chitinophagales bacterium]